MNRDFLEMFLEKEKFPEPSRVLFREIGNKWETDIDAILAFYNREFDHTATVPLVDALAEKSGCNAYSIWMLITVLAAEKARESYADEDIYWEIYQDLRYKLMECYDVFGIWGNFVSFWYTRHSKGDIVQLGRLQFETRPNPFTEPKQIGEFTVDPGEKVYSIHIPASGEPFDTEARLASIQRAYDFFCGGEGRLVCLCGSWLLYPGYEGLFGKNVTDFRKDFCIYKTVEKESFSDKWRVFGKERHNAPELLPERTSLQRRFKKYICDGGTYGSGTGLLIYDGERILTRSE